MDNNSKNIALDDMSRLKWACRRGMLELDMLLSHFLEEAYPDLSDQDKTRFIRLLSSPDPDLFSWLMGKSICDDKELQAIVDKVSQHAKNRF